MQSFGFSLPLTLSTLVAYIVLFFAQGFMNKKEIALGQLFSLDKPQGKFSRLFVDDYHNPCLVLGPQLLIVSLIGFLLLWLSKMKITSHVWFPTSERLAMIYKLIALHFLHFPGKFFCI